MHLVRVVWGNGTIGTLAGTALNTTFGGDGPLPAATTALNAPAGMALDAVGRKLFVAERGGARVRVISLQTSTITLVAGTGTVNASHDSVDGAPALSWNFSSNVRSVAWNPCRRTLLIADSGSGLVLELRTDARMYIIAGSTEATAPVGVSGVRGTSVRLQTPQGLSLDADGQILYIAEAGGAAVRGLNCTTGYIYTVMGTGTLWSGGLVEGMPPLLTPLSTPTATLWVRRTLLVADSMGALLFGADFAANRTFTLSGNGTYASDGDGGPALWVQTSVCPLMLLSTPPPIARTSATRAA
jgi:DNA-binding beta-propeller fold protein YncE